MITSKQRAKLRSIAQKEATILYIGKEEISENLVKQALDALEAREIIKCSVQQNSDYSVKEACDLLCDKTGAQGVSVIGRKFVIYKKSEANILGM